MDAIGIEEHGARDGVTWIGHATALARVGGDAVLIDPLGRRRTQDLDYSAILITHSHVDHLNRWTLAKLDKSVTLYVPTGAAPIVENLGFAKVTEVEPGDQIEVGALEISCVGTKHDNGRWRRGDSPICCGYVVGGGPRDVYHAGDIDMSDFEMFDSIGAQFNIGAALLPIGGMLPVWYYRSRRAALDRGVHIDPDTALRIFEQIGAETLVPVHWGTVNLRLGGVNGPKKRLLQVADEAGMLDRVSLLAHGESVPLSEAATTPYESLERPRGR